MDRRQMTHIQMGRKKRRKHSMDNSSTSTADMVSTSYNSQQLLSASTRQLNVIDRVMEMSKYNSHKTSGVGLYELGRDWINSATSLNETSRLNEHRKQTLLAQMMAFGKEMGYLDQDEIPGKNNENNG